MPKSRAKEIVSWCSHNWLLYHFKEAGIWASTISRFNSYNYWVPIYEN